MKTIAKIVTGSLQACVLSVGTFLCAAPVYADPSNCTLPAAETDPISAGASCSQGPSQKNSLFGAQGVFTIAANTLIFIIGAVSVLYLIFGGLRYVTSGGDSKAVTLAKDTILYAIVGVVIAVVSFALINFVINALNAAA